MKVTMSSPEEAISVVKRMVFLAYEACGGPMGMGVFQAARLGGKDADEDTVWKNAYNQEDYAMRHGASNEVYCDYVFGRMMKWRCKWNGSVITVPDRKFTHDYQSFCHAFPDNKALLDTALYTLRLTPVGVEG